MRLKKYQQICVNLAPEQIEKINVLVAENMCASRSHLFRIIVRNFLEE